MVIVLCSAQLLPRLRGLEIANQTGVEVANPSPGMTERVRSEVPPKIEVDPLEVVSGIVRHKHNRHARLEPFFELTERLLRAVDPMERFDPSILERVDIDRTELAHVSD